MFNTAKLQLFKKKKKKKSKTKTNKVEKEKEKYERDLLLKSKTTHII